MKNEKAAVGFCTSSEHILLKENKFSILHLNIDYLNNKKHELISILETVKHDIICFNETKLTELNPDPFAEYIDYQTIRRDRVSDTVGGGVLVLVRNNYKILKINNIDSIEAIYLQLQVSNEIINIISCYKPPNESDEYFLNELEDFTFNLNLNENLLIIGDMNMDMSNSPNQNHNMIEYLMNNNLKQKVAQPTRICTKYYEKTKQLKCSETMIDLVIHNNDFIADVNVIDCAFSDHKFVLVNLNFNASKKEEHSIIGRNLSTKKIHEITKQINLISLTDLTKNCQNVNEKWICVRKYLLNIINTISPEKKIKLKNNTNVPWFDVELLETKAARDKAHKQFLKSKSESSNKLNEDHRIFNSLKKEYNELLKHKMISYFKDTSPKDFKNSKKFWKFYESIIKLNSSKSNEKCSTSMKNGVITANKPSEICEMFSMFFTSLSSESTASRDDSEPFIDSTFEKINKKRNENNLNSLNTHSFEFKLINNQYVQELIDKL